MRAQIREHSPWIVETQALSAARASSRRPSSRKRRRTRLFISAAAFSVKVIASTRSTSTPSSVTARTKRSTRTVVLPVPAPARTSSEPSRRSTALRCSGVSSVTAAPAHRRVLAAAVPVAAVRARAQIAGAHERVGLADPPERPVELLPEVLGVEAVGVEPAPPELVHVLASIPRGRGSSLPSAT